MLIGPDRHVRRPGPWVDGGPGPRNAASHGNQPPVIDDPNHPACCGNDSVDIIMRGRKGPPCVGQTPKAAPFVPRGRCQWPAVMDCRWMSLIPCLACPPVPYPGPDTGQQPWPAIAAQCSTCSTIGDNLMRTQWAHLVTREVSVAASLRDQGED